MTTRAEVRELKEEQATVWAEARALLEERKGQEWRGEDESKWAAYHARIDSLEGTISRYETLLAVDAADIRVVESAGSRPDEEKRSDDAFFKYLRYGMGQCDFEERELLAKRFLQVGDGAKGGYTVPDTFWNRVSETMLAYSDILNLVNVITTSTGNDLHWLAEDDTANKGAILVEGDQISEQDVAFSNRSLGAYLYTSKLVKVSWQLLQDSALDVEAFLARKFAIRLARIHNDHFTTGTGTGQPDGIVTGATTGKTTASPTAITYDEIVDLVHSIDPAYRSAANARFMFNDAVLAYLRKVRDDSGGAGLGRPLWEPSVQVGVPSTIFGYPYSINQSMASTVAATNTVALFGDFNTGYVVRRVKGLTTVRLDERYADYLQTGFFAYDRMDGTKDDLNAYKALVMHT